MGDLFGDGPTANACAEHLTTVEPVSPLWSVHALHGLVDAGALTFVDGTWCVAKAAPLGDPFSPNAGEVIARQALDAVSEDAPDPR